MHFSEMFMTWRVPRDLRNTNKNRYNTFIIIEKLNTFSSINDQHIDKIIRDQFNSTYSKSYNGMPQGFNPLGGFETPETNIVRTRNTETRENYLVKIVEDPIRGLTT